MELFGNLPKRRHYTVTAKFALFLDLETTGLKPEEGAVILSIGAIAELRGKANAGKVAEFEAVVLPTSAQWEKASPEALKVNGMTWGYLEKHGKPLEIVMYEFLAWLQANGVSLEHHFLVGQNPQFDLGFLKCYMPELQFIGFPLEGAIDNRDLYSILVSRKVMPFLPQNMGGRKSENLSQALGVTPEPWPHTALEGARAVQRNYQKMIDLGVRG
jgi:DNA polymerase III epsilon subunit-like protein